MKKVIVIAGPTAVGKSKFSVDIAKQYNGEIISGDSMQVYKEMTIGTAKVTAEEMEGIPHHLIDIMSYRDEYNVKEFQKRARDCIQDIINRGKLPIICGGTGLYIKACLYDYEFLDQTKDEKFTNFLISCTNSQLYAMLQLIDKDATKNIHQHNRQRLIRAIEMAHFGKRKSDIVKEQTHELIYDAYMIGLTLDREELYERINQRVDMMMDYGLLDEIKGILKSEEDWQRTSLQGIGYKEWKGYFHDEETLERTIENIKKNSRNFAKRQFTWFRNQLPMHWYDVKEEQWNVVLKGDLDHFLLEE